MKSLLPAKTDVSATQQRLRDTACDKRRSLEALLEKYADVSLSQSLRSTENNAVSDEADDKWQNLRELAALYL
jgi:hypothetical protein